MAGMKSPCVYILASQFKGTLYTGVTSDIERRMFEHRNETHGGFSKRYDVKRLVFLELHERMDDAIHREKQIKKWNRDWKIRLIEQDNPQWRDLAADWFSS